jgi:acetyl esterase/lipase
MTVLATLLGLLAAGTGVLYLVRVRSPRSLVLWMPKALAGSAAVLMAAMGLLGAAFGLLSGAPLAMAAGLLGALLPAQYVVRVAAGHDGFARAFGPDWQRRIAPERQARMLKWRWVGRIPARRGVRCQRDLPFWTMPGTGRQVLCDLWQPPEGTPPSGLATIYLHGGAWHWMDKDFGTRPFFGHLAVQGHVVMDVAYRLCPEVGIQGMVGDARRAVAWMKANAATYGVDPGRVVLAGGSSGGHVALLAAYAPDHPGLTSDGLGGADTSVRAVVAYYSMSDTRAVYEHFDAAYGSLGKASGSGRPGFFHKITGTMSRLGTGGDAAEPDFSFGRDVGQIGLFPWLMANLLGGLPDEVPEVYELASPVAHVGSGSPPTLLLQGAHDSFLPAQITRALHGKLLKAGVPSVYVEFPQTEHGFDLLLPRYAPAAQAALYDVERFLALVGQAGSGGEE